MPEVSVVVPSFEPPGSTDVETALERGGFGDYEVVVRDDDGITTARNEGLERASADKLVFLDDDSRPAPDYLSRVSRRLDREAAVAGRTVHSGPALFERMAAHYDFGDAGRYVTRFWGCNMALRRDVFEAVGPWDEGMAWGHEEKELADRVLEEYPIYYDPDAVVHHPYADSIPGYWWKRYRQETQTPYYWETQGIDGREQWIRVAEDALDPTGYVGVSVPHTVARAGETVAATAGRIRGMLRARRGRTREA